MINQLLSRVSFPFYLMGDSACGLKRTRWSTVQRCAYSSSRRLLARSSNPPGTLKYLDPKIRNDMALEQTKSIFKEETKMVDSSLDPLDKEGLPAKHAYAMEMTETINSSDKMTIRGFGRYGFFINNDFHVGSVAVFNDVALKWNASSLTELTPEHFTIADLCEPRLDLIIIGTGENTVQLPEKLVLAIRKIAPVDCCSTFHAATTFNLMNQEDRLICAFLLAVDEEE